MASCGADNIVSCLYWDLTRRGILGGEKAKRVVIIADNCAGQKNNFCVLKFYCWLVETDWVDEVVLFFLNKRTHKE